MGSTHAPSTRAPSTPAPSSKGCSGDPCLDTSHCRSKWGSCGASTAYCNDESIWTADGCTNFEAILEPTAAPTTSTSVTTVAPQLSITTTVATSEAPTTASPATTCAKRWEKCGGRNWTGPTCCEAGDYCFKKTDFYSQCKPTP